MSRQPYVRPMPKSTWYMRNKRYRVYILREISCLLVAGYSGLMIYALSVLATGSPADWQAFVAAQKNPLLVLVHAVALAYFLFYQTFAWFKLAPKAMPLQIGEKRLPGGIVVAGHYVAWIVLSAFIFWLAGVL
ncbi:MAG: hypothetical protein RQ826_02240 [Xanthomonadales bacterium]|nr:hypothetical protein [Xanthomonadales bacterium]